MSLRQYCIEHGRDPLLREWDAARNGGLTPSDVSFGSHQKAWWRCPKGHSYRAAISSRAGGGTGCPFCAGQKVIQGENDLATQYPQLAAQWDRQKNGALIPEAVTSGSSRRKVWWLCDKGHAWRAVVNSRTGKQRCGCPICAGRPLDRCTAILSEPPAEPVK